MKYVIQTEIVRQGIPFRVFYNPQKIQLIHHGGFVSDIEDARYYDSDEAASADTEAMVSMAKKVWRLYGNPLDLVSGKLERDLRASVQIVPVEGA
jgi:hypothetical protein